MHQLQEQFGQMHVEHRQGAPSFFGNDFQHQAGPVIQTIEPLPILGKAKVGTTYEGFTLTKFQTPLAEPTWAQVVKTPMMVSSELLAIRARNQGNTAMKIYNGKEMSGNKKRQVDALIAEKNAVEMEMGSQFEWKLAHLNLKTQESRKARQRIRETVSMDVILRRIPRLKQFTNSSPNAMFQPTGNIVDVSMMGVPHAHPQAHRPEPMYMPAGGRGPPSVYAQSHNENIIEIAPGPRHGGGDQQHSHGGPPPEVYHDHFEPHGLHPMMGESPLERPEIIGEPEQFGHSPSPPREQFGHSSSPPREQFGHSPSPPRDKKGDKRDDKHGDPKSAKKGKHEKPDIHNSKPRQKSKDYERGYDSGSDYDVVFDKYSDNETVLITPESSVSGESSRKYGRHRESDHDRHRRDSYRDVIKPPHREHRRRSPPPSPRDRDRRSSFEDEGYVVIPAKTVRKAASGFQRMSSMHASERPYMQQAYTYDARDYRDHPEPPRRLSDVALTRRDTIAHPRRESMAFPRKVPEYSHVDEWYRPGEKEAAIERRERELDAELNARRRDRLERESYYPKPVRYVREYDVPVYDSRYR
ncbi:hypothetical protein MMC26_000794 [Xylographa opegraphella]|nr:hypothetical protein [Xylographa opegraphella]